MTSLFKTYSVPLINAIKKYLESSDVNERSDLEVASVRIPAKIKKFYEEIASSEKSSLNSVITSTLEKTMTDTIDEYKQTYTPADANIRNQIDRFFTLLKLHEIDINDIDTILSWASEKKVENRSVISNYESMANILTKKAQTRLSTLFGCSYDWLSKRDIRIQGYISKDFSDTRWFRNTGSVLRNRLIHQYEDSSIQAQRISFLCDNDLVFSSDFYLSKNIDHCKNVTIMPIIEIDRIINGVEITSYYLTEAQKLSSKPLRNSFYILVKSVENLVDNHLLKEGRFYKLKPETLDRVNHREVLIKEAISCKIRGLQSPHFMAWGSNQEVEDSVFSEVKYYQDENYTTVPNPLHFLDQEMIISLLDEMIREDLEKIRINKEFMEKEIRCIHGESTHMTSEISFSKYLYSWRSFGPRNKIDYHHDGTISIHRDFLIALKAKIDDLPKLYNIFTHH